MVFCEHLLEFGKLLPLMFVDRTEKHCCCPEQPTSSAVVVRQLEMLEVESGLFGVRPPPLPETEAVHWAA